jgi:dTDP-4-amino-4,6-dideoxygalactose transaminase
MAAKISANSIALPVGQHLNEEDMNYIVQILKEAIRRSKS